MPTARLSAASLAAGSGISFRFASIDLMYPRIISAVLSSAAASVSPYVDSRATPSRK